MFYLFDKNQTGTPELTSFHEPTNLWPLKEGSSKIHMYVTWSRVCKRVHGRASLLFETCGLRYAPERSGKRRRRRPRGFGESAITNPDFRQQKKKKAKLGSEVLLIISFSLMKTVLTNFWKLMSVYR